MHLLVLALAVLWVWEYLLILLPIAIPAWLRPVLVAGCAVAAPHVAVWVLQAAAVAGAVALLHRYLTPPQSPQIVTRRRTRGLPPL